MPRLDVGSGLRSHYDDARCPCDHPAFEPVKGSRIGELAAKFNVVLGLTPES